MSPNELVHSNIQLTSKHVDMKVITNLQVIDDSKIKLLL